MKNYFKRLWRKITSKKEKSVKPLNSPVVKMHKPKFAIIVGHSEEDEGATTYKRGLQEYGFNKPVAINLCSGLCDFGYEAKVFFRNGKTMRQVSREVNAWGANVTIELHLNSYSKKAYGCEVLAELYDKDAVALGDFVSDELQRVYGIKQRDGNGVKEVKKKDRGFYNLDVFNNTKFTSILIEPCFANFKTHESEKIIEYPMKYASTLAVALHNYYNNA